MRYLVVDDNKEMEHAVENYIIHGYYVKSRPPKATTVVKYRYGTAAAHILLLILSLGVFGFFSNQGVMNLNVLLYLFLPNLFYSAIMYKKDEVCIKIERDV